MNKEDATFPENVNPDEAEVVFDDDNPEVLAHVVAHGENIYGEVYDKPFNPQNGRWYDDDAVPRFKQTSVGGALRVDCAYEDCNGFTNVQVEGDLGSGVSNKCDECGEDMCGRHQFTRKQAEQRRRNKQMSTRMEDLQDEFAQEMRELRKAGAGRTAILDYLMVSVARVSLEEWAEASDVRPEHIEKQLGNIAQMKGEKITYRK